MSPSTPEDTCGRCEGSGQYRTRRYHRHAQDALSRYPRARILYVPWPLLIARRAYRFIRHLQRGNQFALLPGMPDPNPPWSALLVRSSQIEIAAGIDGELPQRSQFTGAQIHRQTGAVPVSILSPCTFHRSSSAGLPEPCQPAGQARAKHRLEKYYLCVHPSWTEATRADTDATLCSAMRLSANTRPNTPPERRLHSL